MIDAAGAIYVIGGLGSTGFYNDVWASTDGGARPDSRRGTRGGTGWVLRDTTGVLEGCSGRLRAVLSSAEGY